MSEPESRPKPRRSTLRRRHRSKPPGLPPGSATFAGESTGSGTVISVYSYDREDLETVTTTACGDCFRFQGTQRTTWLHISGLADTAKISQLGQHFGMHPLLIEDVLNTHGRQKVDFGDNDFFVVLRLLGYDEATGQVENQHLAVFVARNVVLTFVEAPTRALDPVIQRLKTNGGRIRSMTVDYLAWAIVDAVVDHYFVVIDGLDTKLQALDDEMQDGVSDVEVRDLFQLRRECVTLHRYVRPIREIASLLSHSELPLLTAATSLYYRDRYDHAVHALDQADDLRELANGLRDFFLASVNNRMNEIMKVLACVSTIFLPLTFLVGIYGMNFDFMPELHSKWGYPVVWLTCAAIAAGMLVFFRRRRWL